MDLDTQDKIFGGHWECVVEFEIPGSAGDLISSSEPVPFTSAIGGCLIFMESCANLVHYVIKLQNRTT